MRNCIHSLIIVVVIGPWALEPATAQSLTRAEFEKLHREILPANETWKSIPWHTDLLSAQRAAANQNKPIFIWAMDGHPLGCT